MEIQLSYTTKLETVTRKEDIKAILDAKLNATSPAQTVDYIGLAADHIQAKRNDIKNAIAQLRQIDQEEEARLELIKEQCAEWLEETGLEKLEGHIVSSITVNSPKPKEDLIIDDEEACFNAGHIKTVLDKASVKKALQNGEDVEGARLEVTHVASKIKINKKRTKPTAEE